MASRTLFFRYRSDVRPVAWVLLAAMLTLLPFVLTPVMTQRLGMPTPHVVGVLTVVWFVSLWARCRGPYSQHNHGHLPVFGSSLLNGLYDAVLTFITGYPTALWELHHNIGHHRRFLTPEDDVASIVDPKTGRPYSRLGYTVRGNLTIHRDALRIARAEAARGRPKLLRKLSLELAVQIAVLGALAAWDVKLTLLAVVIPNVLAGALVWWESYVHHLGVPSTSIYDGSVTTTGKWFNHRNFNIGHHTAHHEKPTLHWSLLPGRTAVIAAKIPEACWRGETPGPGGLLHPARPSDTRDEILVGNVSTSFEA
jgi:fatty acid desaturase